MPTFDDLFIAGLIGWEAAAAVTPSIPAPSRLLRRAAIPVRWISSGALAVRGDVQEPDLHLVAAPQVAHQQIVDAVAAVGGVGGDAVAHLADDQPGALRAAVGAAGRRLAPLRPAVVVVWLSRIIESAKIWVEDLAGPIRASWGNPTGNNDTVQTAWNSAPC
jgi:hypothetical protein